MQDRLAQVLATELQKNSSIRNLSSIVLMHIKVGEVTFNCINKSSSIRRINRASDCCNFGVVYADCLGPVWTGVTDFLQGYNTKTKTPAGASPGLVSFFLVLLCFFGGMMDTGFTSSFLLQNTVAIAVAVMAVHLPGKNLSKLLEI